MNSPVATYFSALSSLSTTRRPPSSRRGSAASASIVRDFIRIQRWHGGADLIYSGPNGLSEWTVSPEDSWHGSTGPPSTEQPVASIQANFDLPAKAIVEFEIAWEQLPNFVFSIGSSTDEASSRSAVRFEVWDREIVVVRESETQADLASVGSVEAGAGRLHLRASIDQESGRHSRRCSGRSTAGRFHGPHPRREGPPGITLTNIEGDVRLDRLVIRRLERHGLAGHLRRQAASDPQRRLRRVRNGGPVRCRRQGVRPSRGVGRIAHRRGPGRIARARAAGDNPGSPSAWFIRTATGSAANWRAWVRSRST